MYDKKQLKKGVLEVCILAIINRESTYGYKIEKTLAKYPLLNIKEGTLYPLLSRLHTKKLITYKMVSSKVGPKRKYYQITRAGVNYISEFIAAFNELSDTVCDIINNNDYIS